MRLLHALAGRQISRVAAHLRLVVIAALTALGPAANAQALGSAIASPPPDSTLGSSPLRPGFAAWRATEVRAARFENPVVIKASTHQILLLSPLALDGLSRDELFGAYVDACRRRYELVDAAALATHAPWREYDASANARAVGTIVVTPVSADRTGCGTNEEQAHAATMHGVQVGTDSGYHALNDVRGVELWVAGRLVAPLLAARAPLLKVTPDGRIRTATGQARVYFELDAVSPLPDGTFPAVEIRIATADPATRVIARVPGASLRALWWSALSSRATAADAEAVAIVRSSSGAPEEWRRASVLLASVFAAGGDDAASRVVLRDVVGRDPCIGIANPPDSPIRRLVDPLRPPALCSAMTPGRTLARALVPGLANASSRRSRALGVAVGAAVIGAFTIAVTQRLTAQTSYREYQQLDLSAASDVGPFLAQDALTRTYDAAERARKLSNTGLMVGSTLWALSAADAVLVERRRAAYLRTIVTFGSEVPARSDGFADASARLRLAFARSRRGAR